MSTKIALVTGASRGLGKEMAIKLAEKGIDIILTYNSKSEVAEEVVSKIERLGQKAKAFQLNTANIKSFDVFLNDVSTYLAEEYGDPYFDFLINNAGIGIYQPFMETTEEMFDDLVNINFKGVYFLTQKSLKYLRDGSGIINISSGLARFSLPNSSAYGALKSAVDTFTRYVAKEMSSRKIRANVVAPGAIATDFGGGENKTNLKKREIISGATALGRVGEPDDIGGVVAFLCSDDAKWINGQRIEVSGGIFL